MSIRPWLMCVVFMITNNLHLGNSGWKKDLTQPFPGSHQPFRLNSLQSPFIDLRPDEISTYNKPYVIPLLFLRRTKRYIPDFGNNYQKLNTSNTPTGDVINKISDNKGSGESILTANLKSAIWEMKTNIETIYRRQDLMISYVKCSSQNNYRCRQIGNELSAVESLNWNHIIPSEFQKSDDFFNNGNNNMNENDYIKTVLNAFKTAIQDQTVRQNLLYKYIACGPTVRNSCSAPVIPALKEAFQQTSTGNRNDFAQEPTTVKPQNPFGNILSNIPLVNFPVSGNTWAEQLLRPFSQNQPTTNNQQNFNQGSNFETPSQVEQPIQNTNYGGPIKTGVNEDVLTKTEGRPVVTKKDKDDVSGLISEVWPEANQDQPKISRVSPDETKGVTKQ